MKEYKLQRHYSVQSGDLFSDFIKLQYSSYTLPIIAFKGFMVDLL